MHEVSIQMVKHEIIMQKVQIKRKKGEKREKIKVK